MEEWGDGGMGDGGMGDGGMGNIRMEVEVFFSFTLRGCGLAA